MEKQNQTADQIIIKSGHRPVSRHIKRQQKVEEVKRLLEKYDARFSCNAGDAICISEIKPSIQQIDAMVLTIQSIISRPGKYEDKHLLQEAHILCKLTDLLKEQSDLKDLIVLDIGGGNGDLAYIISKVFAIQTTIIDPYLPQVRIDMDPDASSDRCNLSRIVSPIKEFVPDGDKKYFVICKHLCGSGFNDAVDWMQLNKTLVAGLMMLPCCYHKYTYGELVYTFIDKIDSDKLAFASQWKHEANKGKEPFDLAVRIERLLNFDRIKKLNGFLTDFDLQVQMGYLMDDTITPKNLLIYSRFC